MSVKCRAPAFFVRRANQLKLIEVSARSMPHRSTFLYVPPRVFRRQEPVWAGSRLSQTVATRRQLSMTSKTARIRRESS